MKRLSFSQERPAPFQSGCDNLRAHQLPLSLLTAGTVDLQFWPLWWTESHRPDG